MSTVTLHQGDCRAFLRDQPDASIDAVVTDPPAGIGFMGKGWDNPLADTFPTRGRRGTEKDSDAVRKFGNDVEPDVRSPKARRAFIAFMTEVMEECLRVLKPGGYAVVWALPRTSHWTATAIEDAGFEIRDVITHLFGSGFPKSLNVGSGRGTALKPANEHWIIARKPLSEQNVAQNVLRWGTGAINIDACRVEGTPPSVPQPLGGTGHVYGFANGQGRSGEMSQPHEQGRWPSNLVLTHSADCNGQCAPDCPIRTLDEQSGSSGGKYSPPKARPRERYFDARGQHDKASNAPDNYGDTGGASRFFPRFEWDLELDVPFLYVPKASRSERNQGCDDLPPKLYARSGGAQGAEHRGEDEYKQDSLGFNRIDKIQNHHPTVKPVALMRWLVRLVTPPGGVVLDPFCGSGTTGVACVQLGFDFVGCEGDPDYFPISEARIGHAQGKARQLDMEFSA